MSDAPNPDPERTTAAPTPGIGAPAPRTGGEFNFGPPAAPGEVGTLGPYRVVKEIGRGGMGAVFRAVDMRLERDVAIKVMLPQFAADSGAKERFLREAKAVARVGHDNVVALHEADEREGVPYIAMQFLQGVPLDKLLETKGSPPLVHCVRIVREAALGLAAAHAVGLVHRDIKPSNLWLEAPNGRVKVLDFGLAKPVDGNADMTASGALVGTPAYMSLEQARGEKVDHRTDIFSLGAVLYQLLTGHKPFVGENPMEVYIALGTQEPPPVRELKPDVPVALADLVHEMLAKEPAARPQTAAEVAERLRKVLSQPSEVSTSLPVVVQPLPVPVQVSAQESAFADLFDDMDRTEQEAEPVPAPKRGKALLFPGGLALAAMIGVAIALGTGSKKPDEVTKKGEDPRPVPKVVPKDVTFPTQPKAGDECDVEIAPNTKMRFCYIPAGECQLGSPKSERNLVVAQSKDKVEPSWLAAEAEENRGKFSTKGFWMGKYEVTQAEWAAVMRGTALKTPSEFRVGGAEEKALGTIKDTSRFPVGNMSWDECQEFLKRANAHRVSLGDKTAFNLPHEDEWEYACRGSLGNKRPYYFGDELNGTQANCNGTAPFGTKTQGDYLKRPQPVGSYEDIVPHPWRLCDMHGNVWEWCRNASEDDNNSRIVRGGSGLYDAMNSRAAYRNRGKRGDRYDDRGFRVICVTP